MSPKPNVSVLTEIDRRLERLVKAPANEAVGANSFVRRSFNKAFEPTIDLGKNRYIWLGTHKVFNGLTLTFREHEAGLFIAHSYKFDDTTSTFIVECSEATWRNARFDWKSDPETCEYLSAVFQK